MKLGKLATLLNLNPLTMPQGWQDYEVSGGFCGDLLSDVLAKGTPGSVWFTVQSHINTVAVAVLKDFSAVVVVNEVSVDHDAFERAELEGLPLFSSEHTSYDLCVKLGKEGDL